MSASSIIMEDLLKRLELLFPKGKRLGAICLALPIVEDKLLANVVEEAAKGGYIATVVSVKDGFDKYFQHQVSADYSWVEFNRIGG